MIHGEKEPFLEIEFATLFRKKNINLHASKFLLKKLLSKVKPTFLKETLKQFIKIVRSLGSFISTNYSSCNFN